MQGETSRAPSPHYLGILGKHQAGLQPLEALCQRFCLSAPSDHRTKLTKSARNPSDPKQRHDPPKVTKQGTPAQPEAEPGSHDSSSPGFALGGDRDRAVKAGTDCKRRVPTGHFRLASRSTRAENAFQVALPPAGSSALCWASFVCSWPGSSPRCPTRWACCWAALLAVSQPACFTPEGPFTQKGLTRVERPTFDLLTSHMERWLGARIYTQKKPEMQVCGETRLWKAFSGRHDPSLGSARRES